MKCRDCENLIWGYAEGERIWQCRERYCPDLDIERDCPDFAPQKPDIFTAFSTLQADNERLRAELEQVKQLYETEKEDFLDYACSGIPNFAPYCFNRRPDCVDERGWCRSEKCHGFSRERDQKED